jgi:methylmalonyl-CoA mutase N-terminal domain/subunit
VGVNRYLVDEPDPPGFRLDPDTEARQIAGLARIRARRDAALLEARLAALDGAAGGAANLMPFILEAVRAYATVGEISDTLRRRFGTQDR